MATVKFTPHLKRFFPDLEEMNIEVKTVAEAVDGKRMHAGKVSRIMSLMSRGHYASMSISYVGGELSL